MSREMMSKSKLEQAYAVKTNKSSVKEIDTSQRIIKAVANTYNFFDYDFDVLRKGCASKSIQERGYASAAPDKILHALFHDLTKLPGKSIMEAEMSVDGNEVLYCESKLAETEDGEETLIKYQEGIYNQHSIGFRYVQLEYFEKEGDGWDKFINNLINPEQADKVGFGWEVTEINLHEWSTVAFGANKLTPYLGSKSANKAVVLNNLYTKLDALIAKAKRLDVKDKKLFELQYNQLKQMISEVTFQKPIIKDTTPRIVTQPSVDFTWDWANLKENY